MNLLNPELYSHHSFRRSAATAAYEHGCTAQQTMHFGAWSSTNVMENYIVHTKTTKRKVAEAVLGGFECETSKIGNEIEKEVTRCDTKFKRLTLSENREVFDADNCF